MAATKVTVLQAIVEFVKDNNRRAPSQVIAGIVGDDVANVKAIVKDLVSDGSITSSRGRYGGCLPVGVTLEKAEKKAQSTAVEEAVEAATDAIESDVADQFAALVAQLEAADVAEPQSAVG